MDITLNPANIITKLEKIAKTPVNYDRLKNLIELARLQAVELTKLKWAMRAQQYASILRETMANTDMQRLKDAGVISNFDLFKKLALASAVLPSSPAKLETAYRTVLQTAMQAGSWDKYRVVSTGYLMYDAVDDSRTRESHFAMDGIIRPVNDPFWSTHAPPNGFNCRCRLIPLSKKQAEARGGIDIPITDEMQPDKGFDGNPQNQLLNKMRDAVGNAEKELR